MAVQVIHNEKELLIQVAEGDEQAFNALFVHYRHRLYAYLLRITKSPEVAEEIVIDIFMKLWVGRELLLNIRELEGFLHKVAYNKAMDFFKTSARHARLRQAYIQRMEQEAGRGADELLIDEEARKILLEATNQLTPQRKLIYTLSREQGLTHEQIAVALGLSRSTVKNTIIASTRSISEYLQKNHPGKAALSLLFFFY